MVNEVSYRSKKGCFISRFQAIIGSTIILGIILTIGLIAGLSGRSTSSGKSEKESGKVGGSSFSLDQTKNVTSLALIDYRLPKSLKPLHYLLQLQPFLSPPNFTFNGNVKIDILCLEATNQIVLHKFKLKVLNDTIKLINKKKSQKTPQWIALNENPVTHFFTIKLNNFLKVNDIYTLEMEFSGILEESLRGLYLSSFKNVYGEKSWMAASFFPPADARMAYPCFDEPEMKSVFSVVLIRRQNQLALSNMPIDHSESRSDGWVEDHFLPTPLMSTYLVAFVICENFSSTTFLDKKIPNRQFKVWAREDVLDQTNYSLHEGHKILEFFEDYFNMTYVLNKIDMIALPELGASAMENWGLITYRESDILFKNGTTGFNNLKYINMVMGHEIGHQWFGNLVTHKWWNDLWLKEGFASYMSQVVTDHMHKDWGVLDLFVCESLLTILDEDCLGTSHPLSVEVNNPEDIYQIYDGITYSKGQALIRMMEFFLGKDTFRKGLDKYVKKYQYSNADQNDLWEEFTKAAWENGQTHIDVKKIMDTWTLQMGYPILTVTRNYSTNSILVNQTHFIPLSSTPNPKYPSPYGYKWIVPLSLTGGPNPNWDSPPLKWLNLEKDITITEDVPLKEQWLLFNTKAMGFYRTNYDDTNWHLLSEQLRKNLSMIHVLNRAQIVDDALSLARLGTLDYNIAFKIASYLQNETEYIPWRSAVLKFAFLEEMFIGSRFYKTFQVYVRHLITDIYNTLDWNADYGDKTQKTLLMELLIEVACFSNTKKCISKAKALFSKWKANPDSNLIPSTLRNIVYCTSIKHGSEEDWEFAFEAYKKENVANHKIIILSSLCCTKEFWLLNRLLQLSLEFNEIKKQDVPLMLVGLAQNPIGKHLVWDYLRENIKKFQEEFQGGFSGLSSIFEAVISCFASEVKLEEVYYLIKSMDNDLGILESGVKQGIEKAKIKINWRKKYEQLAGKSLEDFEKNLQTFTL